MEIFLREVAKQLFDEYGQKIGRQCVVFPNRRSALFFTRHLSQITTKPLWSPKISTINELFAEKSGLQIAEPLSLIFELYASYCKLTKAAEPFDDFYFWGEMLVNDFDDIDKYLVDPSMLFQNLKDLREIDEKFGGLEPEVIEIIRKFWIGFDPSKITAEKANFLSVWQILSHLYKDFKSSLRKKKLAYEGMIMRDIIEMISHEENNWAVGEVNYHFVGFNALNKCEKELLKYLKEKGIGRFYWDYDDLYVKDSSHEAGFFIRDNIDCYGQDLVDRIKFDNIKLEEQYHNKWQIYNAPSDVAQAKLLPEIMADMGDMGDISMDPQHTAVVLADENMLMPLINSLPAEVKDINITMGYPLFQTPVYSLVHMILKLQKNVRVENGKFSFYHIDVLKVLKHQYITLKYKNESNKLISKIKEQNLIRVFKEDLSVCSFFDLVFTANNTHTALNNYLSLILQQIMIHFGSAYDENESDGLVSLNLQQEYIYILVKSIKQLDSIFRNTEFAVGIDVYIRVIDRMMRKLIIPFSGEPLKGLQVMGILETRALDFENVIILSVNEGVLPRASAGNSYIPYNLRMAFGLPTIKHQDSIYAYYFYRLIQRAGKVRFIYNSSTSGTRTGEMSRFLLQLKYSRHFHARFISSKFSIIPQNVVPDLIRRTNDIQNIIEKRYLLDKGGRPFSPSALNIWVECRMRFYYRYIAGLKEPDDVQSEIDSPIFGNILHQTMNYLYEDYVATVITKSDIGKMLLDKKLIENIVSRSFREKFMKNSSGKISGRNLIIASVIGNMIEQILKVDYKFAPFKVIAVEKQYKSCLLVELRGKKEKVEIGGTIDRVDQVGDVVRILDYKSGRDKLEITSIDDLMMHNKAKRNGAAFQTLIYSLIYSKNFPEAKLRPSLYPVRLIYDDNFSDIFTIGSGQSADKLDDFNVLSNEFGMKLTTLISDILDPEADFSMTTVTEKCRYCSFSKLCDRQSVK